MEKNIRTTTITESEKRLRAVFELLKRREKIIISAKKTRFNDTELRLIGEVLSAKEEGRRLISTQLARLLGITRSAVSQIVNHLEKEGVVVRVPDAVDRKIAYVEITERTLKEYEEEVQACMQFVDKVVEKFGAKKFDQLCSLLDDFLSLLDSEQNAGNTAKK